MFSSEELLDVETPVTCEPAASELYDPDPLYDEPVTYDPYPIHEGPAS